MQIQTFFNKCRLGYESMLDIHAWLLHGQAEGGLGLYCIQKVGDDTAVDDIGEMDSFLVIGDA